MRDVIDIVCHRAKGQIPKRSAVRTYPCHRCSHQVWVAAASLNLLKRHKKARVTCRECILELQALEPAEKIEFVTTDEQEIETLRETGKTQTETIHERFGMSPKKV